jgi:hypothetical protein
VKEADLVQRFVERARNIQPLGRVPQDLASRVPLLQKR